MNSYGSANKSDNWPVTTQTFNSIDGVVPGGAATGIVVNVGNYNWHSYQVIATGATPPVGTFVIQTTNGSTFGDYYSAQLDGTTNPSGLMYSSEWLFEKSRALVTGSSNDGVWTITEKHGHL